MNYVHFLKHHAPLPQLCEEIEQPNNNSAHQSSERHPQNDLENKLKRKVNISSRISFEEIFSFLFEVIGVLERFTKTIQTKRYS